MTEYSIRTQVLLTVKLRNQLDGYKERHGITTDSVAIRQALTDAFAEDEKINEMMNHEL